MAEVWEALTQKTSGAPPFSNWRVGGKMCYTRNDTPWFRLSLCCSLAAEPSTSYFTSLSLNPLDAKWRWYLPTSMLPPNFIQVFTTPLGSHELPRSWTQLQKWPNCPSPLPMSCPGVDDKPALATEAWRDYSGHSVTSKRESLKIMHHCICLNYYWVQRWFLEPL